MNGDKEASVVGGASMNVARLLSVDAASPFAGRRVLFTGGSGFVGGHMVRQALAAGVEAHLLGRRPGPGHGMFHAADLENGDRVAAIVRAVAPELVFHMAAPGVIPGTAGFADMIRIVTLGTQALLAACAALPLPPVVVQVGSGFEYAPSGDAVNEDFPLVPSGSLYGVAKAAGSVVAGGFAASLPIMLVRPFHIYGPGEAPQRLGPFLIAKTLAREPVELTALEQRRDFLHVDDCCRALWAAAASGTTSGLKVLNLGSGEPIMLRQFVEELVASLRAAGHAPDIRIGALPYRVGEPMVSLPDVTHQRMTLDWRPRIPLRAGVDHLVRWSIAPCP